MVRGGGEKGVRGLIRRPRAVRVQEQGGTRHADRRAQVRRRQRVLHLRQGRTRPRERVAGRRRHRPEQQRRPRRQGCRGGGRGRGRRVRRARVFQVVAVAARRRTPRAWRRRPSRGLGTRFRPGASPGSRIW